MNYLTNFLTIDEINQIYEIFDINVINNINEENVYNIIKFLIEENVYFIEDMLTMYLDLFLLDYPVFKERFVKLKVKYKENYLDMISSNMNILEEML